MAGFAIIKYPHDTMPTNSDAMAEKKTITKYLPRTKRVKKPPAFRITERDIKMVEAAAKYRFLDHEMFVWLASGNSGKTASTQNIAKRLRLLYQHGYLTRIDAPAVYQSNRLVYAPTELGAKLVAEQTGVAREEIEWNRHKSRVSAQHIAHLLALNQVMVLFSHDLRMAVSDRRIAGFEIEPGDVNRHKLAIRTQDAKGHRVNVGVVPDALLTIRFNDSEAGVFWIEVDRNTISVRKWSEKVAIYNAVRQARKALSRHDAQWALVLTITPEKNRLVRLARATAMAKGGRGFWFTTKGKLKPNKMLKQVWVRSSSLFLCRNEEARKVADYTSSERESILDAVR